VGNHFSTSCNQLSQCLFKECVHIRFSFASKYFPFWQWKTMLILYIDTHTHTNKLFNFRLMNVHFLGWLFNGLIFLVNIYQCFQLQNLLCLCNKLQLDKRFNNANIITLTLLHMYNILSIGRASVFVTPCCFGALVEWSKI
jgi:hypothetical protein